MDSNRSSSLSASKGGCPAIISYISTPRAHQSTEGPYSNSCRICSGDGQHQGPPAGCPRPGHACTTSGLAKTWVSISSLFFHRVGLPYKNLGSKSASLVKIEFERHSVGARFPESTPTVCLAVGTNYSFFAWVPDEVPHLHGGPCERIVHILDTKITMSECSKFRSPLTKQGWSEPQSSLDSDNAEFTEPWALGKETTVNKSPHLLCSNHKGPLYALAYSEKRPISIIVHDFPKACWQIIFLPLWSPRTPLKNDWVLFYLYNSFYTDYFLFPNLLVKKLNI